MISAYCMGILILFSMYYYYCHNREHEKKHKNRGKCLWERTNPASTKTHIVGKLSMGEEGESISKRKGGQWRWVEGRDITAPCSQSVSNNVNVSCELASLSFMLWNRNKDMGIYGERTTHTTRDPSSREIRSQSWTHSGFAHHLLNCSTMRDHSWK